ncbi:MAG: hypothetical protein ACRDDZ_05810 [Marinifilaceae bacterium]
MLRIYIDNKLIVLPSDLEMVLKLTNPIFNDRNSDTTYPFEVSLSANREVFGFINRLDVDVEQEERDAKIVYGALVLMVGKAVITDVHADTVEFFITADNRSFWKKASVTNLIDLFPADTYRKIFSSEVAMSDDFKRSVDSPTMPYYVAPLYDKGMTRCATLPVHPHVANHYINSSFPLVHDRNWVVRYMFMRLRYVLLETIKNMGYTVGKNFFTSVAHFNSIVMICRRFPNVDSLYFYYRNFLPAISVDAFIEEIEKKFNVKFCVNENSKTIDIVSVKKELENKVADVDVMNEMDISLVDKDERYTGYALIDESGDEYSGMTSYEVGISDNMYEVECNTALVGRFIPEGQSRVYPIINKGDLAEYSGGDRSHSDYAIFGKQFRLSVARGWVDGFPTMSAEPLNNPYEISISLPSLYAQFHDGFSQLMMAYRADITVQAVPSNKLLALKDAINNGYILIRGKKFYVREQEITLTLDGIREHSMVVMRG